MEAFVWDYTNLHRWRFQVKGQFITLLFMTREEDVIASY